MDDIDRNILDILQQNSKISNVQLAEEMNLAPSTTLERVKKLESLGIIKGYSIILDKEKIGIKYSFILFIKLGNLHKKVVESFITYIREIPEITEMYRISGNNHFMAKLYCKSVYHYNEVMSEIYDYKETIFPSSGNISKNQDNNIDNIINKSRPSKSLNKKNNVDIKKETQSLQNNDLSYTHTGYISSIDSQVIIDVIKENGSC